MTAFLPAKRDLMRIGVAAFLATALSACSEQAQQSGEPDQSAEASVRIRIEGAGATFPKPLYERWIAVYREKLPGVAFSYDGVGSGEGVRRFLAEEVDFGASDAALSDAELARVGERGAVMVPMTAGMVALAYNLPGVDDLRLSRKAVLGIFSGEIRSWDDQRIQASNPGLALPKKTVTPVVRRDSSGTTFIMTNHLSAASLWWASAGGPGVSKQIDWPGSTMKVNYSSGVAQRVKLSEGAIGYMEYEFAERLGLPIATLENKVGEFVAPAPSAGTAALASAPQVPDDLRVFVPDPPGPGAYPIVGYSWLLLYQRYPDAAKRDALKDAVLWGLTEGQSIAEAMGYIPLPDQMVRLAKARVDNVR